MEISFNCCFGHFGLSNDNSNGGRFVCYSTKLENGIWPARFGFHKSQFPEWTIMPLLSHCFVGTSEIPDRLMSFERHHYHLLRIKISWNFRLAAEPSHCFGHVHRISSSVDLHSLSQVVHFSRRSFCEYARYALYVCVHSTESRTSGQCYLQLKCSKFNFNVLCATVQSRQ